MVASGTPIEPAGAGGGPVAPEVRLNPCSSASEDWHLASLLNVPDETLEQAGSYLIVSTYGGGTWRGEVSW